jgi:hypothetical protein
MSYLPTYKMFRHFEGRFIQTIYRKISMETSCFLQLKLTCDLKACLVKERTSLRFYFLCLSTWGCDRHLLDVCSWRLIVMATSKREAIILLDFLYLVCCWILCGGSVMEDCDKERWWRFKWTSYGQNFKKKKFILLILCVWLCFYRKTLYLKSHFHYVGTSGL